MKKLLGSFFLFKALTALMNPLFLIMAFDLTSSPMMVGLTATFLTMGSLIGSHYWGKLSLKIKSKKYSFTMGFVSFILPLLLLVKYSIWMVLFVAFIYSFLNNSTYFSLVFLGRVKDYKKRLIKVERIGAIGWVFGMLMGLSIEFVPLKFILVYSAVLSIFLILFTYKTVRKELFRELGKGLLVLNDITNLIVKSEKVFFDQLFRFLKVSRNLPTFLIPFFKKSYKHLSFHIPFFVITFSFGLVYPQMISLIKLRGIQNFWIYLFFAIDSLSSFFEYGIILKMKNFRKKFLLFSTARLFSFVMISFGFIFNNIQFIMFLIFFFMIKGITWSFLVIYFGYLTITKAKSEFGLNIGLRSLAYSLGSFVGGVLIETIGYHLFLFASFFMVLGIALFKFNYLMFYV